MSSPSPKISQTQKVIDEILEAYPEKARKDRAKHFRPNDPTGDCSSCAVKSNVKSRPGVMTVRGCAYAGSKGTDVHDVLDGTPRVTQECMLFPHMTVCRNIEYALKGLRRAERAERVAEMLEVLCLQGLEDRRPHELSGGQKQRAQLARTLARRPKVPVASRCG